MTFIRLKEGRQIWTTTSRHPTSTLYHLFDYYFVVTLDLLLQYHVSFSLLSTGTGRAYGPVEWRGAQLPYQDSQFIPWITVDRWGVSWRYGTSFPRTYPVARAATIASRRCRSGIISEVSISIGQNGSHRPWQNAYRAAVPKVSEKWILSVFVCICLRSNDSRRRLRVRYDSDSRSFIPLAKSWS